MTSHYHRQKLLENRITLQQNNEKLDINSFSMITPVQRIDGHFETQLCFRTFDWLLANQIVSNEVEVEKLS